MSAHVQRVVVAGATSPLGQALCRELSTRHEVLALSSSGPSEPRTATSPTPGLRSWKCDLFSIPDTEVALAGADTLVFLARTSRQPARLTQGEWSDLDALMADSAARAASRSSLKRIVLFACGDADVREPLLRRAGVPLAVLRGGGPEPVAALTALVEGASAEERALSAWSGSGEAERRPPSRRVVSVQRYPRPQGWSADDVGWGYVQWLDGAVPLVSVERIAYAAVIRAAGVPVLRLRRVAGRCEADCLSLDVADGALVGGDGVGRFEFRVPLGSNDVVVSLHDFEPALPWPVYRVTQAIAHGAVMKRFGRWLARQPARS